MFKLIAIIVVLAAVAALIKWFSRLSPGKVQVDAADEPLPYESLGVLFSPAERSFLGVLDQVVGDSYRVFGKVRLADVIKTKSGLTGSERQKAWNQIQSKHLDFIVCDPSDLSIQFAIELDDSSHNQQKRQSRDAFIEQALVAAEIPLFRFPAKKAYTLEEIRSVLFDVEEA